MLPQAGVLDRADTVLAVIDIQERLAAVMSRRATVISKTALLVAVAGITGIPVIVTRQYPKGLGELEPELVEEIDRVRNDGADVRIVDKMAFDCFSEVDFRETVESYGRKQLLIVGMEAHICVTQTALAGLRAGLQVHVAADATCSIDEESRDIALMRLGHAGAVVTSSESAAYELIGRAGTDEFKSLLAAVKRSAGTS